MIIRTTLPISSVLRQAGRKYDYEDSFQGKIVDKGNKLQPSDICKAFFRSSPKWIDKLFGLRNSIVRMFGLKTSGKVDREQFLKDFRCEPGEQIGLFKVFEKTENEVILGEDDKHLDFRVSLLLGEAGENGQRLLTISTTVVFKNSFGRFYFLFIKPFHGWIVPAMLKSILRSVESFHQPHTIS